MKVYLETSVIMRLVLNEPGRLEGARSFERMVTAEITEVECLRTLDRCRLVNGLTDDQLIERREVLFQTLETLEVVPLTRAVLRRASEPFPAVLGTLDAIHMCSALMWQEAEGADLVMATHDRAIGQASRAMRMQVIGL